MHILSCKLGFLYICFAMLHTTLHNETQIVNHGNSSISMTNITRNYPILRPNGMQDGGQDKNKGERVFDMIIPKSNQDVELWSSVDNFVPIVYGVDPTLPDAQQAFIYGVLRSIEQSTCIRFSRLQRLCDGGSGGDRPAICVRPGRRRSSHLGRLAAGPQSVTLANGDGPFWLLHLVGHALGLPHPHTCRHSRSAVRVLRHLVDPAWGWRASCNTSRCRWRRSDPGSALQLAPDELSSEPPLVSLQPRTVAALLAVARTRRAARLSHLDQHALNEAYSCAAHCAAGRVCHNDGFVNERCTCTCAPGFGGERCEERRSGAAADMTECWHHLDGDAELDLAALMMATDGTTMPVRYCGVSLRTKLRHPRLLVSLTGLNDRTTLSPRQAEALFSDVMMCMVKLYIFQGDSLSKAVCVLDYVGELLSASVTNNSVDVVLWFDSPTTDFAKLFVEARLVMRTQEDPFRNLTNNATSHANDTHKMRSVIGETGNTNVIILVCSMFILMGLNYAIILLFRKYWLHKYGPNSLLRNMRSGQLEEVAEEPEDWNIQIEYSDTMENSQDSPFETTTAEALTSKKHKNSSSEVPAGSKKPTRNTKRVSFRDGTGDVKLAEQLSEESLGTSEETLDLPRKTLHPDPSEDDPDAAENAPNPAEEASDPAQKTPHPAHEAAASVESIERVHRTQEANSATNSDLEVEKPDFEQMETEEEFEEISEEEYLSSSSTGSSFSSSDSSDSGTSRRNGSLLQRLKRLLGRKADSN